MRFNIAGAFSKAEQLLPYIIRNKSVVNKFDITVYDGINNCPWNGGRINRDISYTQSVIDFYYNNNITIALTFTNPVIDLNCEIGNHLLEKFHKDGNVIISVNENLVEYIKEKFPLYKHTRSITGFGKIKVPMSDDDLELYQRLQTIYDYIVPRCEHVFDQRFTTHLDLSKYEIMLNDTCIYNCPYYGEHFQKIAEQNIKYKRPWSEAGDKEMSDIEECWLSEKSTYLKHEIFDPDLGDIKTIKKYGENYGMDLKTEQIKDLIKKGVTNFKITGREMKDHDFNDELNLYLIDVYDE